MTVGRKKNDPMDVYETPEEAVVPMLNELSHWRISLGLSNVRHSNVLEPCAGSGSILSVLRERNAKSYAWDAEPRGEGISAIDFLAIDIPPCFDLIITNPPFSKAQAIVDKARSLLVKDGMAAMLLRLAFLESQSRADWWRSWMPERIYVLSKRPSFTGGGTDSAAYAWFIWRNAHRPESADLRLL